jgi:hypothetical protein
VSGPAVPILLLGVLTLLGTTVTVLVTPLMPRNAVPHCCRRRVESFAAHARLTMMTAAAVTVAGVVLLLVDAAGP